MRTYFTRIFHASNFIRVVSQSIDLNATLLFRFLAWHYELHKHVCARINYILIKGISCYFTKTYRDLIINVRAKYTSRSAIPHFDYKFVIRILLKVF